MKAYLRQHEQFSINFTELAIIQVPVFKVLQQYLKHPAFTSTATDEDHEAANGIWIATCSEQTANQNTNIAWQYCKVARKRTTGFTVMGA